MKCPFCGKVDGEVLESRIVDSGEGVRRRRACLKCGKRFTTIERVKEATIWVIKKDGRRELFNREKIRKGILRAVEKRPVPLSLVDDVVKRVEREITKKHNQEISSPAIGKVVLKYLRKIDKVAWLRFSSVYFQFEDLEDFEKLIEKTNPS
jgi:transcriptional repressor NrdR